MMSEKKDYTVVLVVLLFMCAFVESSMAVPITFYFGGTITYVSDPNETLGGAVQVNNAWSGSYTFESTTLDSWPDDSEYGRYQSSGDSMSLVIGDLQIEGDGDHSHIAVTNKPGDDTFSMGTFSFDYDGIPVGELGFILDDPSGLAFSSDVLPLQPPDLNHFAIAGFTFQGWGDPLHVGGTVDYLFPEPASILLLLLGATMVRCLGRPASMVATARVDGCNVLEA